MLDRFYTNRYIDHPDYRPPSRFNAWENHEVGKYTASDDSDGHNTKVFEQRTPATFWSVVVEKTDRNKGYVISFGSGDDNGHLAFEIAKLISEGMMEIYEDLK